jgi:sulfoxide reductase heme-binding subunit YedZ
MPGSRSRPTALAGWPLVGWSALLIGALVAVILATRGSGEAGLRAVIRTTAFTSLVLFSGAFVAAAANRAWPSDLTRWMRQNRRYLGVSFAVSHFGHLAAIISLTATVPGFHPSLVTVSLGGLAYLFLLAMVATSFNRTAAWLGPRAWRALHTTGMYYIWLIFFLTYLPRLAKAPLYGFLVAVLLAGIGVRGFAAVRRRPGVASLS